MDSWPRIQEITKKMSDLGFSLSWSAKLHELARRYDQKIIQEVSMNKSKKRVKYNIYNIPLKVSGVPDLQTCGSWSEEHT